MVGYRWLRPRRAPATERQRLPSMKRGCARSPDKLPVVNGFALACMGRMRRHALRVLYMTAYDGFPPNEALGPVMRKPVDRTGGAQ